MTIDPEISRLADRIATDFPCPPEPSDFVFSAPPAARVVDCVLSLNRNYRGFAEPRTISFVSKFPHVVSCYDLESCILRYPSVEDFARNALALPSGDRRKSGAILGVTQYLIDQQKRFSSSSELDRLGEWANSASVSECRSVGVKYFGIAGFQYLRMLFGANTTKPDIHIIAYVTETIGRKVSEIEAVELLEAAATKVGVLLRSLDVSIWTSRAEPNRSS